MATKLITIKEYIKNYSNDKKSKVYKDVTTGAIKTVERYGKKLIRVKI